VKSSIVGRLIVLLMTFFVASCTGCRVEDQKLSFDNGSDKAIGIDFWLRKDGADERTWINGTIRRPGERGTVYSCNGLWNTMIGDRDELIVEIYELQEPLERTGPWRKIGVRLETRIFTKVDLEWLAWILKFP
jgi:hypothetical protein